MFFGILSNLLYFYIVMTEAKRVPSMGKDDRNFRSHYYENLGFKGVDERKALELLWHEDPLNVEKFTSFALKHSIPTCDRLSVWKVILGVAPRFAKNKEQNWRWKVLPYEDNLRFMKSAGRITDSMPTAQVQAILWLLFAGELQFDFKNQLSDFWPLNFTAISETMFKIYENHERANNSHIEVFYLSKGLADSLRKMPEEAYNEAVQDYHELLKREQPQLYSHFEDIGFNYDIPLKSWLGRGFAGVLNACAIEKVWDKVIGGSLKIMVYVAVALVNSSKVSLQVCQTSQEAIRCLVNTSDETDELIAQDAIEMWIEDGGCNSMHATEKQTKPQLEESNRKISNVSQQSNKEKVELLEPSLPMTKVIRIGAIEET